MSDITLSVIYDKTLSPHFTLTIGESWVRINMPYDMNIANNMIRAHQMISAAGMQTNDNIVMNVCGPDIGDINTVMLKDNFKRIWLEIKGSYMHPHMNAHPQTNALLSPAMIEDSDLTRLVSVVLDHLKLGAHPDFMLKKHGSREKVYNYIRTTTGSHGLSDNETENIRMQVCRSVRFK